MLNEWKNEETTEQKTSLNTGMQFSGGKNIARTTMKITKNCLHTFKWQRKFTTLTRIVEKDHLSFKLFNLNQLGDSFFSLECSALAQFYWTRECLPNHI